MKPIDFITRCSVSRASEWYSHFRVTTCVYRKTKGEKDTATVCVIQSKFQVHKGKTSIKSSQFIRLNTHIYTHTQTHRDPRAHVRTARVQHNTSLYCIVYSVVIYLLGLRFIADLRVCLLIHDISWGKYQSSMVVKQNIKLVVRHSETERERESVW